VYLQRSLNTDDSFKFSQSVREITAQYFTENEEEEPFLPIYSKKYDENKALFSKPCEDINLPHYKLEP
jgi:hypothetical protein